MSTDLLPESVNLFLDDFETSLCLPILVVMILCTAQFIFNRIVEIVNTIYQSIIRPAMEMARDKNPMTAVTERLKGILTTLGLRKAGATNPTKNPATGTRFQEDEWDYCEEDVE